MYNIDSHKRGCERQKYVESDLKLHKFTGSFFILSFLNAVTSSFTETMPKNGIYILCLPITWSPEPNLLLAPSSGDARPVGGGHEGAAGGRGPGLVEAWRDEGLGQAVQLAHEGHGRQLEVDVP